MKRLLLVAAVLVVVFHFGDNATAPSKRRKIPPVDWDLITKKLGSTYHAYKREALHRGKPRANSCNTIRYDNQDNRVLIDVTEGDSSKPLLYTVLYNYVTRMPVFAAYYQDKAMQTSQDRSGQFWLYDCSMDLDEEGPEMFTELAATLGSRNDQLHRGHLVPYGVFSSNPSQAKRTYFYINAAPQWGHVNSGQWKELEKRVNENMFKAGYSNGGFVVTGISDLSKFRMPGKFWKVTCLTMQNYPKQGITSVAAAFHCYRNFAARAYMDGIQNRYKNYIPYAVGRSYHPSRFNDFVRDVNYADIWKYLLRIHPDKATFLQQCAAAATNAEARLSEVDFLNQYTFPGTSTGARFKRMSPYTDSRTNPYFCNYVEPVPDLIKYRGFSPEAAVEAERRNRKRLLYSTFT